MQNVNKKWNKRLRKIKHGLNVPSVMEAPLRPRCGEVTRTQPPCSSAPTPHWPGAPPQCPSCLPQYLTQDGPSSYLEAWGSHALGFQAGDGQRYLLQAPVSRTAQGEGHHCESCWGCAFRHFTLRDNLRSNSSVSYSYKTKDNWNPVRLKNQKKPKHQKTFKTLKWPLHRDKDLWAYPAQPSNPTKHISSHTLPLLQREQRRSKIPLNSLEVGNKKSPWHPIAPLWDARG